ncbi:MAG: hypothetical protein IH983_02020 [Planctomycetes bacterium]|nr:hypothetical protein [Planctomycetota bacterium]
MLAYFLAFAWGICILLSFIGWGTLVGRLALPGRQVSWGQRAAWGMVLSVILGGLLNLFSLISGALILVYLGLGFATWLWLSVLDRHAILRSISHGVRPLLADRWLAAGGLLVVALVAVHYATSVYSLEFNPHDDLQGYFVFPVKMLQIGSMGLDPFSGRQMNALGGQSFLHTFVLCVTSEESLKLLDRGIGMLVVVGLLLGLCKETGVAGRAIVAILVGLLLVAAAPHNISSQMTAFALFLSLFETIRREQSGSIRPWGTTALIAMTAAAICTLKVSLIPACGLVVVLHYLLTFLRSQRKSEVAIRFAVGILIGGTLLVPWMISMYQSAGTPLYPLLGKGYHGSAWGTFKAPHSELTFRGVLRIVSELSPFLLVLALLTIKAAWDKTRGLSPVHGGVAISVAIGVGLGAFVIGLATGGVGVYRYTYAFLISGTFYLIGLALSRPSSSTKTEYDGGSHPAAWLTVLAIGVFLGSVWSASLWAWYKHAANLASSTLGPSLRSVDYRPPVRRAQQSIPKGERVLARLARPYLLDFTRNTIFVADAGASLPPGMPFFQGGEALAQYLLSKSIRYVIYAYGTEAGTTREEFGFMLEKGEPIWHRTIIGHTFDLQDNLSQLANTRTRIYDDGEVFVLDLASSAVQPAESQNVPDR